MLLTTSFGFCFIGLFVFGDQSTLGRVPKGLPKNLWDCQCKISTGQMSFLLQCYNVKAMNFEGIKIINIMKYANFTK